MKSQSIVALFAVLASATSAFGQTAARPAAPLKPATSAQPADSSTQPTESEPDDPEAKRKAEEEAKKSARMQKIQQLRFDRRPSVILRAFAPKVEEEEKSTNPDEKKPEPDPFADSLKLFQQNVTMGNWRDVKTLLTELEEKEGKALYQKLLTSLRGTALPPMENLPPEIQAQLRKVQQLQQQQGRQPEKNTFSFEDVIALADAAPTELDKETIPMLGTILRLAVDSGGVVQACVERLKTEIAKPADEAALDRRQVAKILVAANLTVQAGKFLPSVSQAKEHNDFDALNLLSRHFSALHATEKKSEHLEQAWDVTQSVLASDETKAIQREQALKRAVELSPKIREELGQTWLEESFTGQPHRGMEILSTIGSTAAIGLHSRPTDPVTRLKGLELQTTAVEALLKAAPEQATKWQSTVNLLAGNWLKEAVAAYRYGQSSSRSPMMRRDPFGNLYYIDEDEMYRRQSSQTSRIRAIGTGDLLEIRPSDEWLKLVDGSLKPKFDMVFAQLYLKVNEEDEAFPYIEELATSHPDLAEDLVEEFLRVWTNNHDPNARRNRTNYYMYMYGYERKAESIPLTRSKQQRNLVELSELVKRLRALPLKKLNETLLARAFTTCHSSAEVYQLKAIEKVFGSLDNLEPKTLSELIQQMRGNLVSVWRAPAIQERNKTKRNQKDIEAEILRGYAVARSVIDRALEKHADDWSLVLAKASISHDENNYSKELAPNSEFSDARKSAFAQFERAAKLYAAKVPELAEDEEATQVYEIWFYASLGACDLGHIREENVPDVKQPARIREAILALPGEAAERHMAMFANSLFTRMSAAKPAVKFSYLKNGFKIVGDHKQAADARKVFDYYHDLVTEIKLESVIDGSDVVGHGQPFGVFINLRHTREIERESGGFSRYLQNQNTGRYYYYNYGRPTENYRDKFEEIVHQAMDQQFEVLSVTFQTEDVTSKAVAEYGWRVTPYAYVLLKARGPEVDAIPPVRLDLDFLDTSGYAIIPVETPTVPIDASSKAAEPRPISNLTITQTLDERQADEGKLILEVKATAQGLVPDLGEVLKVAPDGFEVVSTDDQSLSVDRFDPEADDTVVQSTREWIINLQAKEGSASRPKLFTFGTAKLDTKEVVYQRYVDADLLTVEQKISLEEQYGNTSYAWLWIVAFVSVGGVACLALVIALTRRNIDAKSVVQFQMPENVTAFTVLGLLKQIQENNGLSDDGKTELVTSINRLERYYFGNGHPSNDGENVEPNLRELAEHWLNRTTTS